MSFAHSFACFVAQLTSAIAASTSILALTFVSSSRLVCTAFRCLASSSRCWRLAASSRLRSSASCWMHHSSARRADSSLEMGATEAATFEVAGMREDIVMKSDNGKPQTFVAPYILWHLFQAPQLHTATDWLHVIFCCTHVPWHLKQRLPCFLHASDWLHSKT